MKKKKPAAAPAKPRLSLSPRARFILYGLALVVAVLLRGWLLGPDLPTRDLRDADPEVVQAIEQAEMNVRHAPRSGEAWGDLGLLLLAHSYAVEAEACFQTAAEFDRDNWRWLYFKAVAQRAHPEQAVQTLRDALARDSSAQPPRLLRAELLLSLGRSEEADREFRSLLKTTPNNARAQLGLARAQAANDEPSEALETLREARSHLSTRKAAHELLAQIELRLGNKVAAETALAATQQLPRDAPWPNDPLSILEDRRVGKHTYLQRAAALQRSGDLRGAEAVAHQLERQYQDVYLLVEGRERLESGKAAAAEAVLRDALQLAPESIDIAHTLGQALAAQDKLDEAVRVYRGLLKREPGYGPAWLELGRCLQRQKSKEALQALRSAVAYMPLDHEAHEALADCLLRHRLHAESSQHFALARQLRGEK